MLGCVQTWCPSTVPEHGARERFLMGTSVNTPKLQVPTPEFGHGARARVQGLDLVLGHYMILGALEFPVSEHNTIFFQCSGTSARAPNVNTALVMTTAASRKSVVVKVMTLLSPFNQWEFSVSGETGNSLFSKDVYSPSIFLAPAPLPS